MLKWQNLEVDAICVHVSQYAPRGVVAIGPTSPRRLPGSGSSCLRLRRRVGTSGCRARLLFCWASDSRLNCIRASPSPARVAVERSSTPRAELARERRGVFRDAIKRLSYLLCSSWRGASCGESSLAILWTSGFCLRCSMSLPLSAFLRASCLSAFP